MTEASNFQTRHLGVALLHVRHAAALGCVVSDGECRAREAAAQAQTSVEPFVFSLARQNQIAFNEHFLAKISTKHGYDLQDWNNHPAYAELRTYGALAI